MSQLNLQENEHLIDKLKKEKEVLEDKIMNLELNKIPSRESSAVKSRGDRALQSRINELEHEKHHLTIELERYKTRVQ